MDKDKVLHDLKRIANAVRVLLQALDKLSEDVRNGGVDEER